MRAIQVLRGLTILSLVVAPFVVQGKLFGQGCPGNQPTNCACPDSFPACSGPNPCTGNGSIVGNGNWECSFSNSGRQCVTSGNPNQNVLCYTVYPCLFINNQCVPNQNGGGQAFNKIIKIGTQCPGGQ